MVLRLNDLLLCFDGGISFATPSKMIDDVSMAAYDQVRARRNDFRSLLKMSQGSDENIDDNVKKVMDRIDLFTGKEPARIGQVCILGRSNGCSLALGIAAKLQSLDVPLTFVGVSDVTMFPDGRNPAITGIGNLKPTTDPTTVAAKSPSFLEKKLRGFLQPVPEGVVPIISLETVIRASQGTVNHFQVKGNHMRYAKSVGRWIWFSEMDDGEVHGRIDSFATNTNFNDVTGSSDLDLHIDLNTKQHWKDLAGKASAALAQIP